MSVFRTIRPGIRCLLHPLGAQYLAIRGNVIVEPPHIDLADADRAASPNQVRATYRAEKFTASLLGRPDFRVDGAPLAHLRTRKGEWLLALLILHGGRPLQREGIAATLWPDSDPPQALYNLRRTLYDLRHALGTSAWRLGAFTAAGGEREEGRNLGLDLTGCDIDVTQFDAFIRKGDSVSLAAAVELYRGPLLEGCSESWALGERARRAEAYLAALEKLASDALSRHQPAAAIPFLRRALLQEPTRESCLRMLLEALAASGEHATGVQAYRDFCLCLHAELNALPSPETRAAFEHLKADMLREFPAGLAPTRLIPETSQPAEIPNIHEPVTPAGGALPLQSPLYVERPTDEDFQRALLRGDSIILVKGPRQVGKTSLLARSLNRARGAGHRVVVSDLQKLSDPTHHLHSLETLLLAFSRQFAERLDLPVRPERVWDAESAPSENFERYLRRHVLAADAAPLVWALDEVDQLFPYRFASELFGLFRSWHNERALDPEGPWSRITLAMAYATEAHLFITDLNQSPFNVGTRLTLDDFSPQTVIDIDQRLGGPLLSPHDEGHTRLHRFMALVGGHPYLVQRGLQELQTGRELDQLEAVAAREDGPFGDHLRRLLFALGQDQALWEAFGGYLRRGSVLDLRSFYRLRSAGVLIGDDPASARPRCGLYSRYLQGHLAAPFPAETYSGEGQQS